MKISLRLSGGIPLKALRITQIRDIESLDSFSESYIDNYPDTWPVEDLIHAFYSKEFQSDEDVLAFAAQYLQRSSTAKALIADAVANGWELGLSSLDENAFHLDVPLKKIILNNHGMTPEALMRSPYFKNILIMTLARALRDIWHEKRQGGFEDKFGPEGILMLERVRSADCDVMTTLIAWELRTIGESELWRHVLAADEGDIAIVFGCVLEKAATSYPLHKALSAAFDQWYRIPERAMECDHKSLEYIDALIRSGVKLPTRRVVPLDVEVLSCLPDKTAYLQNAGSNILTAPLYAGLHDEVNQTHYMQIVHDLSVTTVQGVAFRDPGLAGKIFPGGRMTNETMSESF